MTIKDAIAGYTGKKRITTKEIKQVEKGEKIK